MKPRLGTKFLLNLQLQSKFLINLIFCLKTSSDWDSLISVGSTCHNFFPIYLTVSMPYNVVLALGKVRLLLSRRFYGTSFSSNTCVMRVGFKLCTVLQKQVNGLLENSKVKLLKKSKYKPIIFCTPINRISTFREWSLGMCHGGRRLFERGM